MAILTPAHRISAFAGWQGDRAAYGAGHFAKSLVWSSTDLLFAYHVNAVLGLSAGATGVLLTCTMLYSGGVDLVVAWLFRVAEGRPSATLTGNWSAG